MNPAQQNRFEVAVIGSGPAGASAALALAQSGHSVVLLEKAALPRYKTCGGGVLARAFHRLPPAVHTAIECAFHSVALHLPGPGLSFVATRPQPLVYMAMRADLDWLLVRQARQAGVQVVESCAVKGLEERNDGVEIIAEAAIYHAKFVVAADGVHGVTAKAAGWSPLPALAPALEHEIYLSDEDFARFSQIPRFDFGAIDGGYAWVFPKRAHLSVGIMSAQRVCPHLPAALGAYLRGLGITRITKSERHGYLIPLAPRRGPLARGRVLLAGDTAGLVDPVTAEGITHAVWSGQLAAAALTECHLDASVIAARYQLLLEQNILGDLRAARFLARLLYRHPRLRDGIFRRRGQKLCEFMASVVMGEARYSDALKRPASYLKLLGL
jgi:geranylgeranyl reductase family protein